MLDNGRSAMLAGEHHEMLACIRCGACLNVCPVYRQTGGHAYGWVYPGPMGSVLTPLLAGEHPEAAELANASTLCGACMDACPVEIPLQDLLLAQRRQNATAAGRAERTAWRLWAAAWSDARRYGITTRAAGWGRWATRLAGHLPVVSAWTAGRELPPTGRGAVPRPLVEGAGVSPANRAEPAASGRLPHLAGAGGERPQHVGRARGRQQPAAPHHPPAGPVPGPPRRPLAPSDPSWRVPAVTGPRPAVRDRRLAPGRSRA